MANNKEENSDFAQIKPAAIDLKATERPQYSAAKKHSKKNLVIGVSLGVLLLAAAVVIFLLPRWISSPIIEASDITTKTPESQRISSQPIKPSAESPYERAQQSKLRKETQEVLAKILDAQKSLENSGVSSWADEQYQRSVEYAKTGDDFYNRREFAQARDEYQQALTILDELVDQVDDVFKELIETGSKALTEGDSETALRSFETALAIDSIDRQAVVGYARAQTLDQINALIDDGDDLLERGELDRAKKKYTEALEIDKESRRAEKQIALADKKILERKFNQAMSEGFSALGNSQYQQARQSFSTALKLKPKSVEARSALNQTRHTITTLNINSLLKQADKLESEERWHQALSKYDAALALDSSLADAQNGRRRTTIRAGIHDKLEQILAQPKRLYDKQVYEETVSFHRKILAVSQPGSLLSKQLSNLETLLDRARQPVTVRFSSNNLTKVTVYRVAELGYFLNKELSIRPGRYVAVGNRDGYKDVRVEFMVDPDQSSIEVNIQAQERIALGR